MDYSLIKIDGKVDNVAEALKAEHRNLDLLTVELHKRLKRATWVSLSEGSFQQIMAKYNVHMAELHAELNRLGAALVEAKVNMMAADQRIANMFHPKG